MDLSPQCRIATYKITLGVTGADDRVRVYGMRDTYRPDTLEIGYRTAGHADDGLSGEWKMSYAELSGRLVRHGVPTRMRTCDRWYEPERLPTDIAEFVDRYRPIGPTKAEGT